jgi:hypothetical protein
MSKFVERYARYGLPVLLILGGLVCLSITSWSNLDAALSWGDSTGAKTSYGAAALAIDIVGVAAFAAVAGILFRQKRYVVGGILSCVVLICVLFSMLTFYQFGVKERVSRTDVAERTHASLVQAQKDSLARKDQVLTTLMSDLQSDAERADAILYSKGSKADREALIKQADAARKQKAQLGFAETAVAPMPVYVSPDPGAEALAQDIGIATATMQKLLTLALGCILVLMKPLAFGLSGALWPVKEDKPEEAPAPSTAMAVYQDPEPQLLRPSRKAPKLIVDPVKQVIEFYTQATLEAPKAKPLSATQLHGVYLMWIEHKNYAPTLTLQAFGRSTTLAAQAGAIRVEKKSTSKGVEYRGRIPVIDYVDAQQVA